MPFGPAIIVQGGGFLESASCDKYRQVTETAANVGYDILMRQGGTAVDAVEQAIRVFEGDDHFNAGRGSCLNIAGNVECDAMIMNGHEMKTGAVISGRHFFHPVSIARKIMDQSPHCALSGDGALKFAQSHHLDGICNPEELKSDNCPNQILNVTHPQYGEYTDLLYKGRPAMEESEDQQLHDTVSAVAIDVNGHLACANSTGGIPGKLEGRVSDASLIGCGAYANKDGAAASNGHGESIIKMTLARQVVSNMETGQNAQEAAENAIQKMKDCVRGHGGVIAIDQKGNFGKAFSTTRVVWASKKDNTLQSGMRLNEAETVE